MNNYIKNLHVGTSNKEIICQVHLCSYYMKETDEKDCHKWKLKTVDPQERSTWRSVCLQLVSYLEGGPLMWMMPLHLQVNQKSDYIMKPTKEKGHIWVIILTSISTSTGPNET